MIIALIASAGILFGIVVGIDVSTGNRLPSWVQWAGSLSFGIGMIVIALNSQ